VRARGRLPIPFPRAVLGDAAGRAAAIRHRGWRWVGRPVRARARGRPARRPRRLRDHRGCCARLRCGRDRRPRARSRGHRRRPRGDRAAQERAVTPPGGELLECADELRPRLVELQAETEERTYYSQEIHEAFLEGGFYDVLVPKRYGGLERGLRSLLPGGLEGA